MTDTHKPLETGDGSGVKDVSDHAVCLDLGAHAKVGRKAEPVESARRTVVAQRD
jgi:hypothetical protein